MKIIIGFVFVGVIAVLAWIISREGYQNETIDPVVITSDQKFNSLDYSDKEIRETNGLYETAINYPHYNNPAIDNEIKKRLDPIHEEFKKTFDSADDVIKAMFGGDNKAFLTITYDIKQSQNMSTIVFQGSEYAGGAHPNPFIITIHINNRGELISLSDVFTVNQDIYLGFLSRYTSKILSDELGEAFFREGVDMRPENWDNWYIEPGKLVILFSAYQVAPYVNGQPEVIIPFSEIESIAKGVLFE